MERLICLIATIVFMTMATAQNNVEQYANSKSDENQNVIVCDTLSSANKNNSVFKGHFENEEYQVWLDLDLYHQTVIVPNQEVFGNLPGYLGAKRDTRKWLITDSEVQGKEALLTIINDYGSEDLTARITLNDDGSYTFTQEKGSTIRIVVNRKWVKLPKKLIFVKK
ncbi:hypothetical protein ETF27_04795 [Prevotella brunnea]|uniref:Uncharacterized protein n=1 Tax=Prevotella brunnea TaxID=2508867 RepID=A0A5C8GKZ6_9BACT|nr:hypothetical protein [Prevotella brunnea]TXJ62371.1 hypothetical protein ETF27_04795 [Prevotella brunnea]